MTNYNDGKIHGWNGGDCPVHPNTVVHIWLRSAKCGIAPAGELRWEHCSDSKILDIIAFQVLKQYVEPKTIWANEYQSGILAYDTKEEADNYVVGYGVIRKAVKYVEVQE